MTSFRAVGTGNMRSHLHDPLGEPLEVASDAPVPEPLDDEHLLGGRRPVEVVIT